MAAFEYKALTRDGRRTSGVISADSARSARRELRDRELTPVDIVETRGEEAKGFVIGGSLSEKDRTLLTRQLAVLLQSGMTVEQALSAAAGDGGKASVRKTLLGVRSQVMEGITLSDALRRAPRAFSPLFRSVVAAGEASGELGNVLSHLAVHLERSYKMRTLVRSALIYPLVLAVLAALMVTALMVWVVPRLVEQFDVLGAGQLPTLTEFVINTSAFIRNWGVFVAAAAIAGLFAFNRAMMQPAFKRRIDAAILKLPFFGPMNQTVSAARFARIYATLSASGATVIESLSGARNAMSNLVFHDAAGAVTEAVQEGSRLSSAMKATGVFPTLLNYMVASGEAARDVPAMMNRAADFLESEFESTTGVALGLLEPLIIIILGGIVGTIVLSIMLPIMQLNTLALGQ